MRQPGAGDNGLQAFRQLRPRQETDDRRDGLTTRVLLSLTAGVHPATTAAAVDEMRAAGVDLAGTPLLAGSPQDGTGEAAE